MNTGPQCTFVGPGSTFLEQREQNMSQCKATKLDLLRSELEVQHLKLEVELACLRCGVGGVNP
jgi:hypothetical protein